MGICALCVRCVGLDAPIANRRFPKNEARPKRRSETRTKWDRPSTTQADLIRRGVYAKNRARNPKSDNFSRFSWLDSLKDASKLLTGPNGDRAFTRGEPAQNDPRAGEREKEGKDRSRRDRRPTRRLGGRDSRYSTDENRRTRPRALRRRRERVSIALDLGRFGIAIRPRLIEKAGKIKLAPILAPASRR